MNNNKQSSSQRTTVANPTLQRMIDNNASIRYSNQMIISQSMAVVQSILLKLTQESKINGRQYFNLLLLNINTLSNRVMLKDSVLVKLFEFTS